VTSTKQASVKGQSLRLALISLAVVAGVTLLGALWIGGGTPQPTLPGLPDAGPLTEWLLPYAQLVTTLAATATVGLMLAAAALIPSDKELLSTAAARASRLAFWTALAWSASALLVLVLALSDTLALPISDALSGNVLYSYVTQVPQGAAWLTSAALAAFVAVAAREADRPVGAWVGLALALVALLPPAVTGHANSAGDHDLATSALVVHVVCVVLWVGGLLALVWYWRVDGRFLEAAVRRFSALALWAYLGVGISGVFNTYVRVDGLSELWTTGYGQLVMLKVAAFAVLGVFGWWHRRRTIPELTRRNSKVFTRFASIEAAIMVATIAMGVALSLSPPPATGRTSPPSAAEVLLGYPLPGPPTVSTVLFDWRPDLIAILVIAGAAVCYARGVLALHRRGDRWHIGRTIAWYVGLSILAFGTMSGLGTYGRVVFSLHMTQHMVLSMLAPILLVLAAPITLALRALPAAGRNEPSGPREWLTTALHSPFIRVLTHPITAFILFISAPYIIYFSGLFEVAMRQHWAHELLHVHFVLVGYLFYESLIGSDPLPYRARYPMRLVTLFASLAFHAFFAVALMSSHTVIAPSYYAALDRPWWTDLLTDQNTGSAFAWAFGELPALVALIVLLIQWSRDDDREARRRDRQADRDGDAERVAYNAMLAERARKGT